MEAHDRNWLLIAARLIFDAPKAIAARISAVSEQGWRSGAMGPIQ